MTPKTTGELLNILSSVHSKEELNTYIKNHTIQDSEFRFHIAFEKMLNLYGKKKSEVIRASNLDRTYAYQILNGTKMPSRNKILVLCLAAGCPLKDTQRLLKNAKTGILYSRSTRDAIIIYGINHRLNVMAVNEMLADSGEDILA